MYDDTYYGHIKTLNKNTDLFMILTWLCRFSSTAWTKP